jgi:hypothetical protein
VLQVIDLVGCLVADLSLSTRLPTL